MGKLRIQEQEATKIQQRKDCPDWWAKFILKHLLSLPLEMEHYLLTFSVLSSEIRRLSGLRGEFEDSGHFLTCMGQLCSLPIGAAWAWRWDARGQQGPVHDFTVLSGCPGVDRITSATWPHSTLCNSSDLRLRCLSSIVMWVIDNKTSQDIPVYHAAPLWGLFPFVL